MANSTTPVLTTHDNSSSAILGFIFVCFAFGTVCRQSAIKVIGVPDTVLCLVFGLVLGAVHWQLKEWDNAVLALDTWRDIDAHVVLNVFLPPLIFTSAFEADTHVFVKSLGSILVLAVPGMLISTAVLATMAYFCFPFPDWGGWLSILLGATLSATDPVAVVALLKELGASEHLTMLVEGESLLNDGSAMVIYLIMLENIKEGLDSPDVLHSIGMFLQLAVCGTIVGLVFALVATGALQLYVNDPKGEVSVMLCGAYGSFLVAESAIESFEMSGVLAVVAYGLYMSKEGHAALSPSVHTFVKQFWEQLEHYFNTIIFVLSGLIIMERGFAQDGIGTSEVGMLFLLYFGIHVARLVSVAFCYPILRHSYYNVQAKEAIVLVWGGLRGAVSLALALNVQDTVELTRQQRSQVLFLVAGVTLMTLLINATTTKWLIHRLQLDSISDESQLIFRRACLQINENTEVFVHNCKLHALFSHADWQFIWRYLPVPTREVYHRRLQRGRFSEDHSEIPTNVRNRWKRYSGLYSNHEDGNSMLTSPQHKQHQEPRRRNVFTVHNVLRTLGDRLCAANRLPKDDLGKTLSDKIIERVRKRMQAHIDSRKAGMIEARHRFSRFVQANYRNQLERGFMGPSAFLKLSEATSKQLDRIDAPFVEWSYLKRYTVFPRWFERADLVIKALQGCPPFGLLAWPLQWIRRYELHSHLALVFELALNFVEAHRNVNISMFRTELQGGIIEELRTSVMEATKTMHDMEDNFPEVTRAISTARGCRVVLENERKYVLRLLHAGELEEAEAEGLLHENLVSMKKVRIHPKTLALPSLRTVLSGARILREPVSQASRDKMFDIGVEVFFQPGEVLIEAGDALKGWYFFSRGSLIIEAMSNPLQLFSSPKSGASKASAAFGFRAHRRRTSLHRAVHKITTVNRLGRRAAAIPPAGVGSSGGQEVFGAKETNGSRVGRAESLSARMEGAMDSRPPQQRMRSFSRRLENNKKEGTLKYGVLPAPTRTSSAEFATRYSNLGQDDEPGHIEMHPREEPQTSIGSAVKDASPRPDNDKKTSGPAICANTSQSDSRTPTRGDHPSRGLLRLNRLGPGNTFGELSLLTGCRSVVRCRAETTVQAFFFPAEEVEALIERDAALLLNCWKASSVLVAELFLAEFDSMSPVHIREMVLQSTVYFGHEDGSASRLRKRKAEIEEQSPHASGSNQFFGALDEESLIEMSTLDQSAFAHQLHSAATVVLLDGEVRKVDGSAPVEPIMAFAVLPSKVQYAGCIEWSSDACILVIPFGVEHFANPYRNDLLAQVRQRKLSTEDRGSSSTQATLPRLSNGSLASDKIDPVMKSDSSPPLPSSSRSGKRIDIADAGALHLDIPAAGAMQQRSSAIDSGVVLMTPHSFA